jgi:ABC-type transport system involved in multi-copper enzyme maturation permease subunit
MIVSLVQAEWKKTVGNRWLVGCLIGVFPLVALVISMLILAVALLNESVQEGLAENPAEWTEVSLFFWAIPNSIIGRLLIIGFAAALFAGEYQWGTWKNLIPRRSRLTLILTKYITLALFIVIAFFVTSMIWVAGRGITQLAVGGSYPPALNDIPPDYWGQFSIQVFTAFSSTLILAGIAAIVALITRSILASVLAGLFSAVVDGFLGAALILLYVITDFRGFPSLYRFTITYNVDNLLSHGVGDGISSVLANVVLENNEVLGDVAIDPPIPGNELPISILIMVFWVIFFVGISAYAFYRQDVTS